jgi:hypothetical protein
MCASGVAGEVTNALAHAGKASDIAGEVAAALAHAALAFADVPALRGAYWAKAKLAYKLTGVATKKFQPSTNAYALLKNYYASSAPVAHVFFAAASMFLASKTLENASAETFQKDALALGAMKEPNGDQKWYYEVPGWDNPWWDGALLMARQGISGPLIDGKPAFTHYPAVFADKWTNGLDPVKCAAKHCCSHVRNIWVRGCILST